MRVTDLFLIVPGDRDPAIALKKFGQSDRSPSSSCSPASFWMYVARVVRGQVLSLKEKEFVEAAQARPARRARASSSRHIAPEHASGPIIVNATLAIAAAIMTESTLSFLGFGVQPPTRRGATCSSDGRRQRRNATTRT